MPTTSPRPDRRPPRSTERQWQPGAWDWQQRAHCRGVGTDLFFPGETQPRDQAAEQERWAKHYCRPCTVRRHCLHHALDTPEHHGIWGGATSKERSALARTRRQPHGRTEPQHQPSRDSDAAPTSRHPRPNRTRPATSADVARLAGVSRATVSRALAGIQVDEKTRRKVLDAAALAGYRSRRCSTGTPDLTHQPTAYS